VAKQEQHMIEVRRYFDLTNEAVASMECASDASGLRSAWEDFLGNFGRTIGRLINFAKNYDVSKAWGHKLRNKSNGDDPGLWFLREARNTVEHGLEPFADFHEPNVSVGEGFVALEGNSSLEISNCTFNGVPTGDFKVQASRGKLVGVKGRPNIAIYEVPSRVRLKEIVNPEKRISVPVPTRIGDSNVEPGNPKDLASEGVLELERLVGELHEIWKKTE
jgi:hypothetical protein